MSFSTTFFQPSTTSAFADRVELITVAFADKSGNLSFNVPRETPVSFATLFSLPRPNL